MASGKIRAIIFDLGGVLIDVDKQHMCAKFAKHSSAPEKIGQYFDNRILTGHEIQLGKGEISQQEFFNLVSKELSLSLGFEEFNLIFSDRFTRKEDSIAILRKLAGNYPIAMLSNTNALHYSYWSRTLGADLSLFKSLILSFNTHLAKPGPKIYLEAAKRLGVRPEECVYIDDVAEYVGAAKGLGMEGIQFTSAAQLETDLRKLGVSF